MGKYETYRAGQRTVGTRHPPLQRGLHQLETQQDSHFDLVRRLCGTTAHLGSTPVYEVDLVLLSVLNRSLDLIDGFLTAYPRWNLSTAAPLVRMQVDNLLRLALLQAAPPDTVTSLLLSGDKLSSHVDPLGPPGKKTKLTDARLKDHGRGRFPWLDRVYDKASGWVHFSSVHIGVTVHVDDERRFFARFPSDIDRYPYEFLEQILWAMIQATEGVVDIVDEFASGKETALDDGCASRATDDVPPTGHVTER